jgi:hypothetical protein
MTALGLLEVMTTVWSSGASTFVTPVKYERYIESFWRRMRL